MLGMSRRITSELVNGRVHCWGPESRSRQLGDRKSQSARSQAAAKGLPGRWPPRCVPHGGDAARSVPAQYSQDSITHVCVSASGSQERSSPGMAGVCPHPGRVARGRGDPVRTWTSGTLPASVWGSEGTPAAALPGVTCPHGACPPGRHLSVPQSDAPARGCRHTAQAELFRERTLCG